MSLRGFGLRPAVRAGRGRRFASCRLRRPRGTLLRPPRIALDFLAAASVAGARRRVATRAITVRARPAEIWPWLAQMGKGRGGLYGVDALDRLLGILDAPSAERILPGWQGLRAGDVIPIGRSPGSPVRAVDPPRALVLRIEQGGGCVTQSWRLEPLDPETTRLVLRVRASAPPGLRTRLLLAALAPQEAVMVIAQLRGIRRRAEDLARTRATSAGSGASPA